MFYDPALDSDLKFCLALFEWTVYFLLSTLYFEEYPPCVLFLWQRSEKDQLVVLLFQTVQELW